MGSPVQPASPTPPPQKPFKERLSEVVEELALEAIGSGLVILIVAGGGKLLEWSIGPGAKFFDLIPVKWVFDAGDLVLVLRFLWRAIKKLND